MQGPPTQVEPKTLADYLSAMTRAVLQPGLNRKVVDAKWPGITEAFHGFDPQRVAAYTPADVERLMNDPRIIRNRRKIEAVIANAGEMIVADREFRGFRAYLRSFGSYAAVAADLKKRFHFLGDSGAYHFLYVVGE
jgi:3-methyladenine DNA glycosylase Tag